MTRRFALLISILALTFISAIGEAAEFVDMVRDLTALQNRMVTGDERARDLVARQFDAIEAKIPELGPDEWILQKNTRAAIVYLLGGGAAAYVRELYKAGFFSSEDATLVEASILYAEGAPSAKEKLLNFDPRAYTPVLGGHLALVQGGARSDGNKTKAIESFDIARLMMPTSLVEEAAIRREIRALDPATSQEKIATLAEIYVRKYGASPYARNFWAEIRALIFQNPREANLELAAQFSAILDRAAPGDQFNIKAGVFRSAVLNGKMDHAEFWLEKTAAAAYGGPNEERVTFYRSIMDDLASPEIRKNGQRHLEIATPRDPEDRALKDVAKAVVGRIDPTHPAEQSKKDEAQTEDRTEVERSAHALIEEVDALLGKRN